MSALDQCADLACSFEQIVQRPLFEDGALPAKVKQLIAVAVTHVTQCPYCIQGHTKAALRAGASREELMEAVWVAAEMRAGAALAHALLTLDTVKRESAAAAQLTRRQPPQIS